MRLVSPYKGLDAFADSDLDALLFFGREREREIVVANLIASRLTVLYGPTGVGKSSLLRAGVARALRELPEEPLVVAFDRWSGDPSADLATALRQAAGEDGAGGLFEIVEHAQGDRDVYLILDQAEEYFVYHDEPSAFDTELARVVSEPLRVNVLLSLREDALAKLDRFKPRIPFVYANSLRLDRLDRAAGEAAIVRPVERWNELEEEEVRVEPKLVEAVLDGIRAGSIEHDGGRGTAESNGRRATVEAPYLQLVMQRIWDVERDVASPTLRASTLAELGGARKVVADHLERAIEELTPSERDVAARLFMYLVTPSGTKIAHALPDLAEYAGVREADAVPVVETLSRHRILRPDEAGRTEIFHDVLAGEILGWRRAHAAEKELADERRLARRRQRRALVAAAIASLVAATMVAVSAFALSQRSAAREQAANAEEARSDAEMQRDRARSAKVRAEREKANALREKERTERARQGAAQQAEKARKAKAQAEASKRLAEERAAAARAARHEADERAKEATLARQEAQQAAALATQQRNRARQAETAARAAAGRAQARALAEQARAVSSERPLESVRLAVLAARREPNSTLAESTLRAALAGSRVRAVLPGGGGPVASATFSTDGRLVLTVSHRARLFDARSGRLLLTLPDPVDIRAAALTRDGSRVVTTGPDGKARLWRLSFRAGAIRTGPPLLLNGHKRAIGAVAFSRDGRFVVTGSNDSTAIVWRTDSGERVSTLQHDGSVLSAIFNPDATVVVTVSRETGTNRLLARMYDARDGKLLVLFDARGIRSAIFAPDGSAVVATSNDNSTHVWDLKGKALTDPLRQDENVVSAAFSPDGGRLVTASEGGDAYVWRVGTWSRELIIPGPLNPLTSAEFSPDGRFVLVSSRDRTARIFRADSGLPLITLAGHEEEVVSASFAPNGRRVVTASVDGTARLWDPGTEDLLKLVGKENGGPIGRFSVSSDGRLAVSASEDGTARVLLIARGRQLHVLRHGGAVNDAEFSPNAKLIVTASDDRTARLWRVDGKPLRALLHPEGVLRAVFGPNGRLVATAGADGVVRIWRTSDGRLLHELRGHSDAVLDLAFSPNGQLLASAGDNGDRTARLWSVSGRELHVLRHRGPVARVAFSPNGRLLATASGDEMARLWNVATGRLVHLLRGHEEFVNDAEFSPDGRLLVTASSDRDARIWSVGSGKLLRTLRGHFSAVHTAAFSPDGHWIVTSGRIGAGLWDASTGRFFAPGGLSADPFLRGHATGPFTYAVFAPDGRRILTSAADGTVRTYVCELCGGVRSLLHLAHQRLVAIEQLLTAAERRRYLRG